MKKLYTILAFILTCTCSKGQEGFGVLVNLPTIGDIYKKASIVSNDLHARYVRDAINVNTFDQIGRSATYEANKFEKLRVVCNINSITQGGGPKPFLKRSDTANYRRIVRNIFKKYQTGVGCDSGFAAVICENEPFNTQYFSGDIYDYVNYNLASLSTVAHEFGIKLADGGNLGVALDMLAWRYFDSICDKSSRDSLAAMMSMPYVSAAAVKDINKDLENLMRVSSVILDGDQKYCDYANIHIYQNSTDTNLTVRKITVRLRFVQKFIKQRYNLELITNEIGQRNNTDAAVVIGLIDQCNYLKFPFCLWYSGDSGTAKALTESNGSLRLNGVAFRQYMDTLK